MPGGTTPARPPPARPPTDARSSTSCCPRPAVSATGGMATGRTWPRRSAAAEWRPSTRPTEVRHVPAHSPQRFPLLVLGMGRALFRSVIQCSPRSAENPATTGSMNALRHYLHGDYLEAADRGPGSVVYCGICDGFCLPAHIYE